MKFHDNAQQDMLITAIYPVTPNTAIMITNSFGGIHLMQWLILERYMMIVDDIVYTKLHLLGEDIHMTKALGKARTYAYAEYGKDITGQDVPF